jgi:glycerate kinase
MAVASGLVLLKEEERNPLAASAYGTGLVIRHAINKGAGTIILGLGGSATNDGGMGILSALGFRFLNNKEQALQASGENLLRVEKIIPPPVIPPVKFKIACDVQNVLFGPQGAAHVYAPQKGAGDQQVDYLDKALRNWAAVLQQQTGKDIAAVPGTGAAGGITAGLLPFFEVEIKKGIEMVVDAGEIRKHLKQADLLITGEGKIDEQSGSGKVVGYMAGLSKEFNVSCIAFCGELQLGEEAVRQLGLKKAIAIKDNSMTTAEAMKNAGKLLMQKSREIDKYL